jgi:flagellar basal-body rod modification protein FlgD
MSIITAATANATTSAKTPASASNTDVMIASNFTTFLQLLTTQLQNQNPMDPLDTNQFTQQLVQFAQVEQQMKSNDQLSGILEMQKASEKTAAMAYVGYTVVVDGATTPLTTTGATWSFNSPKTATANVTIKDATGQTAYSGTFGINAGDQKFTWDGKGTDGKAWPEGNYTMSVTATDASGQSVNISTEIQATVTQVDFTQDPPMLMIGGKEYTSDKVKRIVLPASSNAA